MFRAIAKLFTCLSEARGGIKSKLIKKFITILFKRNRKWQFTYSIMRLILPEDDKDRGNYGLKEKALAKLITQCLNLNKAEYERLYHYKNPNYHKEGMGIGDFSICMFDVVKGYLATAEASGVEIVLPTDILAATGFAADAEFDVVAADAIPAD